MGLAQEVTVMTEEEYLGLGSTKETRTMATCDSAKQ